MEHFKFLANPTNAPDVGKSNLSDHALFSDQEGFGKICDQIFAPNLFVDGPSLAASNLPEASYTAPDQAERKHDTDMRQRTQTNDDCCFQQSIVPQYDSTVLLFRSNFVSSIPIIPIPPIPIRQSSVGFIRDLPFYDYILPPGGCLNFTIVEIVSILPNWFRNRGMAIRFLNNHITASIHLAILQEHRELDITTEFRKARAREEIADAYRKTMRSADPTWTKAKHKIPKNWNDGFMSVNTFFPDVAYQPTYRPPPSITFKQLLNGVKKLPQGDDAGDLTRALEYACYNTKFDAGGQSYELMFPDDIQMILGHIGRTYITMEHTDRYIVRRYADKARAATRQKPRVEKTTNPTIAQDASYQEGVWKQQTTLSPQASLHNPPSGLNFPLLGKSAPIIPKIVTQLSTPTITANVFSMPSNFGLSAEVEALIKTPECTIKHNTSEPDVHDNESVVDKTHREIATFEQHLKQDSSKDYEHLLTPSPSPESKRDSNQMQGDYEKSQELGSEAPVLKSKAARHAYPLDQLLRNCFESWEEDDGSDFVRAARYARQSDQIATDWRVWDLDLILALISLDSIDH